MICQMIPTFKTLAPVVKKIAVYTLDKSHPLLICWILICLMDNATKHLNKSTAAWLRSYGVTVTMHETVPLWWDHSTTCSE